MITYGSVRAVALCFGVTYLVGLMLLAELLGSSADSTATFADHFHDDRSRVGDLVGGVALLLASLSLVAVGLTLRRHLAPEPRLLGDLIAGFGVLGAGGMLVAAGLLLTVPVTSLLGAMFGDPGVEAGAAAGIAQAGTVMLVTTFVVHGAWTAIVAKLARDTSACGGWLAATGWGAAVLALFGVTVVAAFPLGLWWIIFGLRWGPPRRS